MVNNLFKPNLVGGAEISVDALATGLREKGCKVSILTLGDDLDGQNDCYYLRPKFLKSIWPVKKDRNFFQRLHFQFIGDINQYHLLRRISAVLDEFQPDVVHTNNLAGIGTGIWKLCSKKNIPIVHTLRDYYQLCAKQSMFSDGANCNYQCQSCSLLTKVRLTNSKYVNYVVGNSRFTLDVHVRNGYFPYAKSRVISGGLTDKFLKQALRSKINNDLVVGYLGQIIPSKGLEDIVCLANTLEHVKFFIAGNGNDNYIDSLKGEVVNNNIIWLGRVDAIDFFAKINLLIVPSYWHEPLPRVIYEAYSQGVNVLATNTGGNPEVIYPTHKEYLYEPGNKEQLKRNFENFDFIESEKLKEHSLNFTSDRISSGYYEIYRELI